MLMVAGVFAALLGLLLLRRHKQGSRSGWVVELPPAAKSAGRRAATAKAATEWVDGVEARAAQAAKQPAPPAAAEPSKGKDKDV